MMQIEVLQRGEMQTQLKSRKESAKEYCVYNKQRESFLAFSVICADTHLARLKGLLGTGRLNSDEGVWITPSQGIHSVGLQFPIDLIYLATDNRVLELIESFGPYRIGPLRIECDSVLELPTRTIFHSQTQVGDELLICTAEEIEKYLREHEVQKQEPVGPKETV